MRSYSRLNYTAMKNAFYFLAFLALISCKSPSPEALPDQLVLAKQQAPFGLNWVGVKLQKAFYNGRLVSEFFYNGDIFSGYKGYVTFETPVQCAESLFKRNGSFAESYETKMAWVSGENKTVSKDMNPRYTIKFITPKTDSVREVSEEWFASPRIYIKKFHFNDAGFLMKEDAFSATENGYTSTYMRNLSNNISSSLRKNTSSPPLEMRVEYQYDNHPNPFFQMGVDWRCEFSILALSPNNITSETYTDDEGRNHLTTYTYAYLPNGYPSRITIEHKLVGGEGVPFVIDLKY